MDSSNQPIRSFDLIGLTLSIFWGLLLSLLPNLIWYFKTGDPTWIADNDSLLYLTIASKSYYHHLTQLSDPIFLEHKDILYQWILFIPAVVLSKVLSLNPIHIDLIWRIWAGITIGAGWYFVFRQFTHSVWVALGLSVLLQGDSGLLYGQPVYRHFLDLHYVLTHLSDPFIYGKPELMPQWRIITPGLSMGFLLVYLGCLSVITRHKDSKAWLFCGGALGLLFYIYFYYWTAALLGLAIAILLDRPHSRQYFKIALLGISIGLPSVWHSYQIKNNAVPEAFYRVDMFLPIMRFSELLIPKIAVAIFFVLFWFILKKRQDLIFLSSLVLASMLLLNHQIVSSLQIQNFHWNYAMGPALTLLILTVVLGFIDLRKVSRPTKIFCFTFIAFHSLTGFLLRATEAKKSIQAVERSTGYRQFKAQQALFLEPPRLKPGAVIAGDEFFTQFAIILENQRPLFSYSSNYSLFLTSEEFDQRIVLQAYLSGVDQSLFESNQRSYPEQTASGPWLRNSVLLEEKIKQRLHYFDAISKNPDVYLNKFKVTYFVQKISTSPPPFLNTQKWQKKQNGPYWQIWERI